MNTYIYVDGFNLYYGAVKGASYKWLNIFDLCRRLLRKNSILKIKYFTARVTARPGDPSQPSRQGALAASQFPTNLTDDTGSFHKPTHW
jgi:hypothetical protein